MFHTAGYCMYAGSDLNVCTSRVFFYAGISRFSLLCRVRFKLLSILEVHKAPPPTLHKLDLTSKVQNF
jgi:hypothetical protein